MKQRQLEVSRGEDSVAIVTGSQLKALVNFDPHGLGHQREGCGPAGGGGRGADDDRTADGCALGCGVGCG